ncbi:uncharacterized protein ACO6RY_10640 [Pungitius sinensis]
MLTFSPIALSLLTLHAPPCCSDLIGLEVTVRPGGQDDCTFQQLRRAPHHFSEELRHHIHHPPRQPSPRHPTNPKPRIRLP